MHIKLVVQNAHFTILVAYFKLCIHNIYIYIYIYSHLTFTIVALSKYKSIWYANQSLVAINMSSQSSLTYMYVMNHIVINLISGLIVNNIDLSSFIKPDQRNPWIKDQIKITLLPTISHLLLPNFVSCGRACPSHMTQNLVTVGAKLWTADRFIVDPWSMDYADPVW